MNTANQSHEANKQNISFNDLMKLLWKSKKIILGITFLCACLSIAYLLLVAPTYQATVKVLPPKNSDLAQYSETLGVIDLRITGKDTQRSLKPNQVYEILHTQIKSETLKNTFFTETYIPYFQPKTEEETEQLEKRLDKKLKINDHGENGSITVAIEEKDPKIAAQWANEYMALAIELTHDELLQNLKSEINAKKETTREQIATLRKLERGLRNLKINRLQDSLSIAKAMGLEDPMPGTTVISLGNNNPLGDSVVNEGGYLRGTKSLQAEINILRSNEDQDAYIAGLSTLLTQQALLQAVNDSPAFSVARIDMPAHPPYDPIKPIKSLIVMMGIIFGLFLGVFVVLIANAIRNE